MKELKPKGEKAGEMTLSALQSEVMRFADEYVGRVAEAANDLSAKSTNTEVHVQALKWKLGQATAACITAAGVNPTLNALDMVVLATVSRMVAETHPVVQQLGSAAQDFVEVHRHLETNAWTLVQGVLKEEQKSELRDLIEEWRRRNPNQRDVYAVRFREFAASLGNAPEASKTKPTSIFNLLFIDPMAGLDPTARAIQETRQSAERMMYYAQRVPVLLAWQAEVLTYQLAEQPAARQLLADADRFSRSAEAFGQVADKLPALVDQQREAAIKQLLEGLAVERTNLVASLATEEEKMRRLLAETRGTLEAGSEMATSLDGAIQSLHAFVRYVSPPPSSNEVPTTVSTNSRPFDVLDYGQAASQVAAMAKDLNTLLGSVNQSVPKMTAMGEQAQAGAERVVHQAFRLGLLLILILLAGLLVTALTYRVLAAKLASGLHSNARRKQPETES